MNKNMRSGKRENSAKKVPPTKMERFVNASTALGSMLAHMQYAFGPYSV